MALAVGARLGPYEILGALGAGGMGEVYNARDTRLDRTVAIKIISDLPAGAPELQPLTPTALEHIVHTCLAKDPDDRFHAAHDLLLQLKWIAKGGSAAGVPAPVIARRNRSSRASDGRNSSSSSRTGSPSFERGFR